METVFVSKKRNHSPHKFYSHNLSKKPSKFLLNKMNNQAKVIKNQFLQELHKHLYQNVSNPNFQVYLDPNFPGNIFLFSHNFDNLEVVRFRRTLNKYKFRVDKKIKKRENTIIYKNENLKNFIQNGEESLDLPRQPTKSKQSNCNEQLKKLKINPTEEDNFWDKLLELDLSKRNFSNLHNFNVLSVLNNDNF